MGTTSGWFGWFRRALPEEELGSGAGEPSPGSSDGGGPTPPEPDEVEQLRGELAELREELVHVRRLDALGRIATGLAHEYRNVLAGIEGAARQALVLLRPDAERARVLLEEIAASAERAASVAAELMTLGRDREARAAERVELDAAIDRLVAVVGGALDSEVRIETQLEAEGRFVRIEEGQLERVLLNLVCNACDAMPAGGSITIRTEERDMGDEEAGQRGIAPGPYVALSVADRGHGMDTETRDRALEAFFTTKAPEKGCGLGLSLVCSLVRGLGGALDLCTARGVGTTVTLLLPRAEAARPGEDVGEGGSTAAPRLGRVLVVEDEPQVRRTVGHLLKPLSTALVEASTAAEALAEVASEPVDLLVTDVALPDLHGPELARRLSQTRPEIGVVYTSTSSRESLVRGGSLDPESLLLERPFDEERLLDAARAAVGGGDGGC